MNKKIVLDLLDGRISNRNTNTLVLSYSQSPIQKFDFIKDYLPIDFKNEGLYWYDASAVDGNPLTIDILLRFILQDFGIISTYDISRCDNIEHDTDSITSLLLEFLKEMNKRPILLVLANAGPWKHFSRFLKILSNFQHSLLKVVITTKFGNTYRKQGIFVVEQKLAWRRQDNTNEVLDLDEEKEIQILQDRWNKLKFTAEVQLQRDFLLETLKFFKQPNLKTQVSYLTFRIIQDITHELGERDIYLKMWEACQSKFSNLLDKRLFETLVVHGSWIYGLASEENNIKIEILEKALENETDPKEVLYIKYHLANAYGRKFDNKKRLFLLKESLDEMKEVYGENHFEIWHIYFNLAHAFLEVGLPKLTEKYFLKSIQIQEQHLGLEHSSLTYTLYKFALYETLGNPLEKMKIYERIYSILQTNYGPNHFQLGKVLFRMAKTHKMLSREQVLENNQRRQNSCEILDNYFGKDNYFIIYVIRNWTFDLNWIYSLDKCGEFYTKILKFETNTYGINRTDTLAGLGDLYTTRKLHEKMIDCYSKILSNQESVFGGTTHYYCLETLNKLAIGYCKVGDYQKQLELYNMGLRILENCYGAMHSIAHVNQLILIAQVYKNLENYTKAKEILEKTIQIMTIFYEGESYKLIPALQTLSAIHGKLRDTESHLETSRKILEIAEAFYETPDHFRLVSFITKLADAYGKIGKQTEKVKLLERALKIEGNKFGVFGVYLVPILNGLAQAYKEITPLDSVKIKVYSERALVILERQGRLEKISHNWRNP